MSFREIGDILLSSIERLLPPQTTYRKTLFRFAKVNEWNFVCD